MGREGGIEGEVDFAALIVKTVENIALLGTEVIDIGNHECADAEGIFNEVLRVGNGNAVARPSHLLIEVVEIGCACVEEGIHWNVLAAIFKGIAVSNGIRGVQKSDTFLCARGVD